MSNEIRRIVTTHDATGKAIVLFDGDNPHKMVRPVGNFVSRVIWRTDSAPAIMDTKQDVAAQQKGVSPPAGGTVGIPPLPPLHRPSPFAPNATGGGVCLRSSDRPRPPLPPSPLQAHPSRGAACLPG